MTIISILGLSYDKNLFGPRYQNENRNDKLPDTNNYQNSTDALWKRYKNEDVKFKLLATKDAIEIQEPLLKEIEHNEIFEYKQDDINAIFTKIIEILLADEQEEYILDVTHGYRDAPIMAVISSLNAQLLSKINLTIVYAKQFAKNDYKYKILNEYIETPQISFILITFLQTLRVPNININLPLYEDLKKFSDDLMANKIQNVLKRIDDIKESLGDLKNKKQYLSTVIDKLLELFEKFDEIRNEELNYKQYFMMAEFFQGKYHLHAFSYLREAIDLYTKYHFEQKSYINIKDSDGYQEYIKKAINDYIKYGNTSKYLTDKLKNSMYHYCINYEEKFLPIKDLISNVNEIRNKLVHVGEVDDDIDAKTNEKKLFERYRELIVKKDIFNQLIDDTPVDFNLNKCIEFKLNVIAENIKKCYTTDVNVINQLNVIFKNTYDSASNKFDKNMMNYNIDNIKNKNENLKKYINENFECLTMLYLNIDKVLWDEKEDCYNES